MTGLWQISGRSDLTWEESLRLDLRYVDNWSPLLDLSILSAPSVRCSRDPEPTEPPARPGERCSGAQ